MQVADNVLSRKGHYLHEGSPSEYDQVRQLYRRVMTEAQRANLHQNTARLLRVRSLLFALDCPLSMRLQHADPIVQKNYLIQLQAIDASDRALFISGTDLSPLAHLRQINLGPPP